MTNPSQSCPKRFDSLDALRGLAALSVVLWHWHHFELLPTARMTELPMSLALRIFYTQGWTAVYLFFCLSGFVFYWRYSRAVAESTVTLRDFAVFRFSRLYPLHLVTLLLVAAAQAWMMRATGQYFVYPLNDSRHFLLNLLFASSWGFEEGYSFNAPIWSVSVEVLLYALFFLWCRSLPVRLPVLAATSLVGFLFVSRYNADIGQGIGFFFMGGCVFLLHERIVATHRARGVMRWVLGLTCLGWGLFILASMLGFRAAWLSLRSVPFLWRFDAHFVTLASFAVIKLPAIVLFPLTILSLALVESHRDSFGRRLSFLGNASYSIYLLHFPLQLVVAALAVRGVVSSSWLSTPWFMAVFVGVLVLVSSASYHCFEVPTQRFLRRVLTGRTATFTRSSRWKSRKQVVGAQLGHNL